MKNNPKIEILKTDTLIPYARNSIQQGEGSASLTSALQSDDA